MSLGFDPGLFIKTTEYLSLKGHMRPHWAEMLKIASLCFCMRNFHTRHQVQRHIY